MSDNYVIWSFDEVPNALTPKDLLNADDIAMALRTGDSISKGGFEGLQFTADPDYPNDALLTDCIDQDNTKLRVNRLNPNMYNKVRNLNILANKIPESTDIFRIKGIYNGTCVDRSIAEDITQKGFTGIYWKEIDEYRY